MKVVEIFKSIDGEGIRVGYPVTFIRLAGCNLRCNYCDTKYSYENEKFTEMTPQEIYNQVYKLGGKRITLTGGEPLIHKDVKVLVDLLIQKGYEVNIETNGSVDITLFLDKHTIITMDYKCASSDMEDKMLLDNISKLRKQDVLKFVVSDDNDLDTVQRIYQNTKATVYISPVFGRIEPKQIVEYMLEHNMENCRVQVQLHKIIWNPEERGV